MLTWGVIPNVLNVPEDKIKEWGIKSVKSRVTNFAALSR